MRFASMLAVLAGTFLFTHPLPAADAPPDVRIVTVPQAEVWCGPNTGNGLYPTNILRQGERVQVERELDSGWLVVRPPAGSFSWINNRFVQYVSPNYANYVVTYDGHDVPVLIGSSLKMERPNKIGVRLPRGAQVRVVGRPMSDDEGTWLPIEPPEGEVRYLRKESVAKPGSAAQKTASAKAPVQAPDADTLWRDANKADNAGRLADAIRLYRLAGDANLSINPERAEEAYRRAHWIEQANSSTNKPGGSYYYPDGPSQQPLAIVSPFVLPSNQKGTSPIQPIAGTAAGATSGQLVSARAVSTPAPETHYAKGRLQHAFKNEVNRRYHLLDDKGHPVMTVRGGPGVDLSSFEDKNVELWGQLSWDYDRRNHLLTVSNVREVP
jgi:hypothetical protein